MKIYDWIAATALSRKIRTKTTRPGRKAATAYPSPRVNITKLNPIRTFIRVWPAILFANRRTARLTRRKLYDRNSIGIRRKISGSGHPEGINRLKK